MRTDKIETRRVLDAAAVEARGTAHDGCERDLWDPHVRENRAAPRYRSKTHRLLGSKFPPEGVRGDHASVFNDRATPCSTHSDVCSSVAKLASKTKPTPMAFRRSCVT